MFSKHLAHFIYCIQIMKGFSINSFQKMLHLITAQSFNCRLFAYRYAVGFQDLHPSIQFKRESMGWGNTNSQYPTDLYHCEDLWWINWTPVLEKSFIFYLKQPLKIEYMRIKELSWGSRGKLLRPWGGRHLFLSPCHCFVIPTRTYQVNKWSHITTSRARMHTGKENTP